ncbi:MAG: 16S rRNA (uracil(1498)-N(3))-methyltransferase [Clostridia bacterium]|nr:16S rRNA (uracil(1498)-N(3))-methyltransferase [Clostridia bacterium]
MFNFFTENKPINNQYQIVGKDFNHVKNVLRLKVGDQILVSDGNTSNLCQISEFLADTVIVDLLIESYQDTELPIKIYLFQGVPKSDKMEFIIQKAVELGVFEIVPVQMKRCISKLDKPDAKTKRWQAISESAGKQCKRNLIPKVCDAVPFSKCVEMLKDLDLVGIPYESANGMTDTTEFLSGIKKDMKVGILIGPEGGFDDSEIQTLKDAGFKIVSLGKRILRTETASLTALSMIMLYSEIKL